MRIRCRQPRHGGWRDRSPFLKPHSTEVVRRQRNQAKRSIRSPSFSLPPPAPVVRCGSGNGSKRKRGKSGCMRRRRRRRPTFAVRPFNRGQEVVGEKEGGREGGGTEMVGSSNERTNGRWSVERRLNPMNSGEVVALRMYYLSRGAENELRSTEWLHAAADTPRHLK